MSCFGKISFFEKVTKNWYRFLLYVNEQKEQTGPNFKRSFHPDYLSSILCVSYDSVKKLTTLRLGSSNLNNDFFLSYLENLSESDVL